MKDRDKFIQDVLEDIGEGGSPNFYMKLAWDKAVRETEKNVAKALKKEKISYIILELEEQAEWFEENGSEWAGSCLRERIQELSHN